MAKVYTRQFFDQILFLSLIARSEMALIFTDLKKKVIIADEN